MTGKLYWILILTVLILIIASNNILADDAPKLDFDLDIGDRVDNFNWNIAGDLNGQNPNILSELTWSDLKVIQLSANAEVQFDNRFLIRSSLAYGWIYSGQVQDSDYGGNNRTLEFSRSNDKNNGDYTFDISIALGYILLSDDTSNIKAFLGYSDNELFLRMTDGFQTIATTNVTPPIGPFDELLNSTYHANWDGPWIGIDFIKKFATPITFHGSLEYHWADYYGEADWNLRPDFAHPVSYTHQAEGDGTVVTIGLEYLFQGQWNLKVNLNMAQWSAGPGIDRTFLVTGITSDTRLNEVNWDSKVIRVQVFHWF